MRWLLPFALMGLAQFSALASPAAAPSCAREDFAQAVDRAGAALRQLNADNAPRLRAKLRELKELRGWPDAGFEEKAYEILQDERMGALDMQANDLLARLDTLGTVDPGAEPDCAKLEELRAVGIELQATVKAKTAYTLAKLDQMLGGPAAATEPRPKSVETRPPAPVQPAPKATARTPDGSWAPKPAPPAQVATAPPPPPPSATKSTPTSAAPPPSPPSPPSPPGTPTSFEDEGYTIDEIMAASAGFFGKVSANLGAVIEYLFKKSGRPAGYILGTEGGGAFLAGVRYGNGTLYMRAGSTQKIFW
ncbi:MAG TPA: EipA family protein, partial [Hyphomicrobiaceae bacterium]|nr:EipA family protein [Hyphomicrobiaceae bacterium]